MAGRPRIFDDPDKLEKSCQAYFTWCDNNPWIKKEAVKSGPEAGKLIDIPIARPYTLIAMCHHIGIERKTWYNYEERPEFLHITTHVKDKIRNQKYEGAAVGAFNANIIARDLGLTDKQDIKVQSERPLFGPLKD